MSERRKPSSTEPGRSSIARICSWCTRMHGSLTDPTTLTVTLIFVSLQRIRCISRQEEFRMIRPSGACSDTMQSRLCGCGSDIHGHDGVRHKPMRGVMTVGTQRLVTRTSVSNFPQSLEVELVLEHLNK